MMTSNKGKELIKRHEGLRIKAYRCAAGVLTIGWGHTIGVQDGMEITTADAERFLASDIIKCENAIERYVTAPLRQSQYDALISFIFNLGESNFRTSTLLKRINENPNNYEEITRQFLRWNKAAGKVLAGLTKRREDEAKLYCS